MRTAQPHADERPLARRLEGELRARGTDEVVTVEVPRAGAQGAYVFARWGTPHLLLNAHLDTVPPNEGWSADPFTPRRSDDNGGRIYGLGACDTKGAIAAVLCALEAARPDGVAVLFSGDEEHSGTCMRAFLDGPHARGITRAVVFEPTSCRVGTRHRGILSVEARLFGPGGHSSRADDMPAPVAELAQLAVTWSEWGRSLRAHGPEGFRGMCLNIARLDGGVAFNVVPAEATLCASVRPPPGADMHAIKGQLAGPALRAGAQVEFPVENAPFATRDLAAFAPLFAPAAAGAAPPTSHPVDLAFWTEAALLAEAGVDAVVYGPGDIAQAHGPDEWVTLADLERATREVTFMLRATAATR